MILHPSPDYVSDVIRETGDFYEAAILDYLRRTFHREGVIVDVGAMIGNHALYFATFLPNVVVHAFEPLSANLTLLRTNVAGLDVTVHPLALSDHDGTARLSVPDKNNRGHALLGDDGEVVQVRPLDAYAFQDVSLIKVDVEGHEAQVLAGAWETIVRCQPWLLVEDWFGPHPPAGYRLQRGWESTHQAFLYVPDGSPNVRLALEPPSP
jgi:FkbM family methyltransferase